MGTEFITLDLNLAELGNDWPAAVEDRLRAYGEPLRWAITQVNLSSRMASIEAVITQEIRA